MENQQNAVMPDYIREKIPKREFISPLWSITRCERSWIRSLNLSRLLKIKWRQIYLSFSKEEGLIAILPSLRYMRGPDTDTWPSDTLYLDWLCWGISLDMHSRPAK